MGLFKISAQATIDIDITIEADTEEEARDHFNELAMTDFESHITDEDYTVHSITRTDR